MDFKNSTILQKMIINLGLILAPFGGVALTTAAISLGITSAFTG